ncbi:MAG: imelysin family protein [Bdellovibrionaceae bacterium]|nr:imelysin family protein [Pseudobdellovibrionaceae bacterium]
MVQLRLVFLMGALFVTMAALTGTRYQQLVSQLGEGEFSKEKLVLNVALNVVYPNVQAFYSETESLSQTIKGYCGELKADPTTANLQAVQEQWKKAMLVYHKLDAVAFGPLIDNGKFLADNIYSWPLMNTCGVDRAVEELDRTGKYNPQTIFTSKGLTSLEYMFFEETYSSECNLTSSRNKNVVEWLKKPAVERQVDRCAYAEIISDELVGTAHKLLEAWDEASGNYPQRLVDGTQKIDAVINQISDGLFSIESLKDFRLAKIIGLHKECISPNKICPELAEHQWSGMSFEAMEAQALGYKEVFFGSLDPQVKAFGFDDYLTVVGHGKVAQEVLFYVDKVLADIATLKTQGSLPELIHQQGYKSCAGEEGTSGTLCALFHNVRGITTLMKTDVIIALSLQAPPTFQGDND